MTRIRWISADQSGRRRGPHCSVVFLLRYFFSRLFVLSAVFLSSDLTTVNSQVEGAIWPSFQAAKENVTLGFDDCTAWVFGFSVSSMCEITKSLRRDASQSTA